MVSLPDGYATPCSLLTAFLPHLGTAGKTSKKFMLSQMLKYREFAYPAICLDIEFPGVVTECAIDRAILITVPTAPMHLYENVAKHIVPSFPKQVDQANDIGQERSLVRCLFSA